MAPDAGIGLRFARYKLVVSVERTIVFLYMAAKTKLQRTGRIRSTQETPLGPRRRLAGFALQSHIVASGTGEHSILKREIRRDPLGYCLARRHTYRVGLANGVPAIVARSA
jgi:hypothetical protein